MIEAERTLVESFLADLERELGSTARIARACEPASTISRRDPHC